jgi:hypothetical protein
LAPSDLAEALATRASILEPRIKEMRAVVDMLAPQIGRVNLLEVEFECALCEAELAWLQSLIAQLRSGGLTWDIQQILGYLRKAAATSEVKGKTGKTGSAFVQP